MSERLSWTPGVTLQRHNLQHQNQLRPQDTPPRQESRNKDIAPPPLAAAGGFARSRGVAFAEAPLSPSSPSPFSPVQYLNVKLADAPPYPQRDSHELISPLSSPSFSPQRLPDPQLPPEENANLRHQRVAQIARNPGAGGRIPVAPERSASIDHYNVHDDDDDDLDAETLHTNYPPSLSRLDDNLSRAPTLKFGTLAGPRRRKTVKLAKNGLFSIVGHLPDALMRNVAYSKGPEFETVKYTAATCDPDDYARLGYSLRTTSQFKRETEIAIVVTMYNESINDLNR
ncbi:chitin synthase N-terminal-domain-containing protein [Blyttiomyces helicus]|uniref:Chitin synthase N-terminal-domain-containing protein n=1 Tax=Blyttiomyces helicus TaxID=388810 RepID=A0A4P9W1U7_9FUNG|nr:chitin synthase N-terminal-domain-containing protein [Blyttiomyces helicus]|eukprot:RKO86171.1 chitin synthase N-terminal-domain-containing protein [Blyttiomyces helicus]